VFYGDKDNWWAASLLVFSYLLHQRKAAGGGRISGARSRPFNTEVPRLAKSSYKAPKRSDEKIRAFFQQCAQHSSALSL